MQASRLDRRESIRKHRGIVQLKPSVSSSDAIGLTSAATTVHTTSDPSRNAISSVDVRQSAAMMTRRRCLFSDAMTGAEERLSSAKHGTRRNYYSWSPAPAQTNAFLHLNTSSMQVLRQYASHLARTTYPQGHRYERDGDRRLRRYRVRLRTRLTGCARSRSWCS